MHARWSWMLLLCACGDDGSATVCDRYEALSLLLSRDDPQSWTPAQGCPTDQQIAAEGWAEKTLAQCVTYLEDRCQGVDIALCNREQRSGAECNCKVPLGVDQRLECSTVALSR